MRYEQELFVQKAPYLQWLIDEENRQDELSCRKEKDIDSRAGRQTGKQVCTLPFLSCLDKVSDIVKETIALDNTVLYLFVKRDGVLSPDACLTISKSFIENEQVVFVYADEDYRGSLQELYNIEQGDFQEDITRQYRIKDTESYRGEPWLKPDFSPDTLESFFYIGSVFAIRGDKLSKGIEQYGKEISLYKLIYVMLMEEIASPQAIVHIPKVLYTNNTLAESQELCGIGEIKKQSSFQGSGKVSVIIPSKDHPKMLQTCLTSMIHYTNYSDYELIVVDNGSSEENKAEIGRLLDAIQRENPSLAIQYLYEKMQFNFSRMCNKGAKAASGEYLLFLNDDIEVLNTPQGRKWLENMLEYACRSHVGAVGAKLYYPPQSKVEGPYQIQHVGITNMGIGPAHKLAGVEDKGNLYHGHNLVNYDMIAVTAACMLVKRIVFEHVGSFCEELAVAYNDVEFCFRLYEAGFYNVQVNDAVLFHHESFSRGQDIEPEKQVRLCQEKEKLYYMHPQLQGNDPFYHPHLVQYKKDVEYHLEYLFLCDKPVKPQSPLKKQGLVMRKKYDKWLKYHSNLEHNKVDIGKRIWSKIYWRRMGDGLSMMHIDSITYEGTYAIITGWYVLQKYNNAYLDTKLWLIRLTRDKMYFHSYEFEFMPQLREDVAALFENEENRTKHKQTTHVKLAGIHLIVDTSKLMEGTYMVGVLTKNGRKRFAAFQEYRDSELLTVRKITDESVQYGE